MSSTGHGDNPISLAPKSVIVTFFMAETKHLTPTALRRGHFFDFRIFKSFSPCLAGLDTETALEELEYRRSAHFMVSGKQREQEGTRK